MQIRAREMLPVSSRPDLVVVCVAGDISPMEVVVLDLADLTPFVDMAGSGQR